MMMQVKINPFPILSLLLGYVTLLLSPTVNAYSFDKSSRYIILSLYDLGFANRIRSVADFSKIALLSNRKLLVSWIPNAACNITFHELFDQGPSHIESIDLSYLEYKNEEIFYHAVEDAVVVYNMTFFGLRDMDKEFVISNNMEAFIIRRDRFMSDVNVIMATYNGGLALENMSCQQYFTMQSSFYLALQPIPRIQDIVTNLLDTYFNQYLMIGIHYRDHDSMHDWEIIPPPPPSSSSTVSSDGDTESDHTSSSKALKFGDGASVDDFVRVMTSIQQHFSYRKPSGDVTTVRFYIASNNITIKQRLMEHFPTAITVYGDHNRMSVEGIKLALIDWLMLSESAMIINTYGSSYSQEASRRKLVPLVRIYNHQLIYMDDVRLPSCGSIKFFHSGKSLHNTTYSYQEGTWDQRTISGKLVEFYPSSILADWGLPVVYTISP